jgi:GNAT superfamily N-acetyltransferase
MAGDAERPRPAGEQDLSALRDIVELAYGKYLPRMDRPPGPMLADLRPQVLAGQVWVVGSPPVALICLVPDGDALLVENVAVHPNAQGNGLGRRLLDFAEHQARAHGLGRLYLYTHEVMTENIAVYTHLGYREFARREDHGYRRVFMAKVLAVG